MGKYAYRVAMLSGREITQVLESVVGFALIVRITPPIQSEAPLQLMPPW